MRNKKGEKKKKKNKLFGEVKKDLNVNNDSEDTTSAPTNKTTAADKHDERNNYNDSVVCNFPGNDIVDQDEQDNSNKAVDVIIFNRRWIPIFRPEYGQALGYRRPFSSNI